MQPILPTRCSHFLLVFRASLLVAAVGMFGACDQHSAEEVPENYGHGSSHERTAPDHQVDSSYPSKSFSDTSGTREEQGEETQSKSSGVPTPTPGQHFY